MQNHIDATTFDLSSVAKEERQHVVSDHIAKSVVQKRATYVANELAKHPDLDQYGPKEPHVAFVARLIGAGRLEILGSTRFPIELYYLDGQPLVAFLPPSIRLQQADGATAITLQNTVLGPDEMPDRHDEAGHRFLTALVLETLNNAATKT